MLRNSLQGDVCGKVSSIPGPCHDTLLKQRRASAFYKNNPYEVLGHNFNTFNGGKPLGGPIDFSISGYEDAPGTDIRQQDVDLCKMKYDMEAREQPDFNEFDGSDVQEIANNIVQMSDSEPIDEEPVVREEFTDKLSFNNIIIIVAVILFLLLVFWLMYRF